MIVSALKTLTWGTLAFAVGSAVLLAATDDAAMRIGPYTDEPAARTGTTTRAERNAESRRAGRGAAKSPGAGPVRDSAAH